MPLRPYNLPMNKRLIRALLTVLVLGLPAPVFGADINVRGCDRLHYEWQEYKKNESDSSKSEWAEGFYLGYIYAFTDALKSLGNINFPQNGKKGQYATIVGNWLERHPEKWQEDRAICVALALREAFGLKK